VLYIGVFAFSWSLDTKKQKWDRLGSDWKQKMVFFTLLSLASIFVIQSEWYSFECCGSQLVRYTVGRL
jgi:hypothetical protein